MTAELLPLDADDIFGDLPTPIEPGKRTVKFSLPSGVGDKTFRHIVGAANTAYVAVQGIPSIDQIYDYSDKKVTKAKISSVVLTDEFKDAMEQRGISWRPDDYSGISTEQMYAIQILTDPTHKAKTLQAKLRLAGVPYAKYRNWLKQPTFSRYLNNLTEGMLSEHAGDMHTVLLNKALNGDLNAIKYAHELSGRHDPNQQQVKDLGRIVDALIEVISQEVTDQETLIRISNKMSLIMSTTTPIQGEISK
jgi:hypothetical protein